MLIALYSSRIILQALGVDDYGLYNVVGGVIGLMSFLRTSLTSSTQRFLAYEMGRKENDRLKNVFSICLTTHLIFTLIILIISETLGLWFLNTHLQIPSDRIVAANWVYQFSVLSVVLSTISVPFDADIISHEKMTYYAIVSIIEAVLKLLIAFILLHLNCDRLIMYGGLILIVSIITLLMYVCYCKANYAETSFEFYFDKSMFSKIFSFSGWNILGTFSMTCANQGTSILVNMFYPVAVNAAVGIGQQVNGAITGLTANFQTAFQPQITKSYASQDYTFMNSLMCRTSKISYFLLFIVSLPIIFNIDFILGVWLGDVPEYTGQFCILYLLASLFNALSIPLKLGIYASGDIKWYQIVASILFLFDVFIVYIIFKYFDVSPIICMVIKALINFIIIFIRIIFSKILIIGFSAKNYFRNVIIAVAVSSIIPILCGYFCFIHSITSYERILSTVLVLILAVVSSFFLGFTKTERRSIIAVLSSITTKLGLKKAVKSDM